MSEGWTGTDTTLKTKPVVLCMDVFLRPGTILLIAITVVGMALLLYVSMKWE